MIQALGKYRIEERIDYGGVGVVYRAHDPLLNRVVALKVIADNDDLSDELRARFYREARQCAQLSHPNIITIYDLGEEEGRLFLVLEHLEGETLAQMLARRAACHLERKLAIMIQMCEALGYAHVKGIVHRVLSPSSVFVFRNEKIKLLDFGVGGAMSVYGTFSRAAQALGTAVFMAPEQVHGGEADHRSDIFSAGAVFYELLTGRPLQADVGLRARRRWSAGAASLFRPHPDIPDDLALVIERALNPAPEERFASMAEMLAALEAIRARLAEDALLLRRRIAGCAKDTRELWSRLVDEIGGATPDEAPPVLEEHAPVAVLETVSLQYEMAAGKVREQLILANILRTQYEEGMALLSDERWTEAMEALQRVVAEMPQHARAREALNRARDGLQRAGPTTTPTAPALHQGSDDATVLAESDVLLSNASAATVRTETPGLASSTEPGGGRAAADASANRTRRPESSSRRAAPGVWSASAIVRSVLAGALRVPAAVRRFAGVRRLVAAVLAAVILAAVYGVATHAVKVKRLQTDLANVRQQVDIARRTATDAEGPVLAAAAFDEAAAKASEGERHASGGEPLRAIAILRDAEKRFEEAAKFARVTAQLRATADEARTRMQTAKQRERRPSRIPAPLLVVSRAGEVHQYAAHQLGGYREEMCAVLPLNSIDVHQPQIGLVHQRGSLQHVTGSFSAHIESRQPAKFLVYQRHEPVKRSVIPAAPRQKQLGDILIRRSIHSHAFGPVWAALAADYTKLITLLGARSRLNK